MHFPKISRELFMFPASFSRSPIVLVLLHLSEPARSHRENLEERKSTHMFLHDARAISLAKHVDCLDMKHVLFTLTCHKIDPLSLAACNLIIFSDLFQQDRYGLSRPKKN